MITVRDAINNDTNKVLILETMVKLWRKFKYCSILSLLNAQTNCQHNWNSISFYRIETNFSRCFYATRTNSKLTHGNKVANPALSAFTHLFKFYIVLSEHIYLKHNTIKIHTKITNEGNWSKSNFLLKFHIKQPSGFSITFLIKLALPFLLPQTVR